jgi:hypothetical protein
MKNSINENELIEEMKNIAPNYRGIRKHLSQKQIDCIRSRKKHKITRRDFIKWWNSKFDIPLTEGRIRSIEGDL